LDYDGTLADFAPTPDHVEPQPEVIELVTQLATHPRIQVAVVSGRRLDHIETLLPISEAILAGTYGIEIRAKNGKRFYRVEREEIRPELDKLKSKWEYLLGDREGFYLEDKGWALAIHARFVEDSEAHKTIHAARNVASTTLIWANFGSLGAINFWRWGHKRRIKAKRLWVFYSSIHG
jgi:trehalose 6-phosphate phosphatase